MKKLVLLLALAACGQQVQPVLSTEVRPDGTYVRPRTDTVTVGQ